MKKLVLVLLALFVVCAATSAQTKMSKEEAKLFQTEIDFAKLAEEKGVQAAFAAYLAEDAVLLPANGDPVEGRDAIVKFMGGGYTLLWKPLRAEISKSGEMGYTYGTSETRFTDKDGKPQIRNGKYMSVWKKQKDGSWKVIVDMGNTSTATPAITSKTN